MNDKDRIDFLNEHIGSLQTVKIDEVTDLRYVGAMCNSHLALLEDGNDFTKTIARYRVDKLIDAVNSSSSKEYETDR